MICLRVACDCLIDDSDGGHDVDVDVQAEAALCVQALYKWHLARNKVTAYGESCRLGNVVVIQT